MQNRVQLLHILCTGREGYAELTVELDCLCFVHFSNFSVMNM